MNANSHNIHSSVSSQPRSAWADAWHLWKVIFPRRSITGRLVWGTGVSLFLAALGLPLFMIAGFSWSSEAIPPVIRIVSYIVPSTSAIDGFVKLSQLGAPLSAVSPEFFTLWALAFSYNFVALVQAVRGAKPLRTVRI